MKNHNYKVNIKWTGNTGSGTSDYSSYSRNHEILIDGKKAITASSDPMFRGDPTKHNPEDLFLSSLSSCHMLWYLHLCTANKITVTAYTDYATGIMEINKDGSGKFINAILNPTVTILEPEHKTLAKSLHIQANQKCFIANSCNLKIDHIATTLVE